MANDTVLVVGAGFAGAVVARVLAESGIRVHVIDRRSHIGGNCFDELSTSGVRVHRYGPHLFHTNMEHVVAWLTRFGRFVPYEHRVEAILSDGQYVPLPVNRRTINAVFGTDLKTTSEVETFLAGQAVPCSRPSNAAEYLNSQIGTELTNRFFRPYTLKMWDQHLEQMEAQVVKRIPLRYDLEDRYFSNDKFQMLPRDGYSSLFSNILDSEFISVDLNVAFDKSLMANYRHCFNSMAIDEYFDEIFGPLPYRSIRFHHREVSSVSVRKVFESFEFSCPARLMCESMPRT